MKLKSKVVNSNHDHALLSPSSARKWMACPAALACEFGIPNESGQAAVNGTAMHTLAEIHLNQFVKQTSLPLERNLGAYVLNEGKGPVRALAKAESGAVKITEDMLVQVGRYTDYCIPIALAAELFEVESRVNLTRVLHPGVELSGAPLQTFGTADLVAVMPRLIMKADDTHTGYMLIVGDLKTGRHKVLAKENKQMMLYALGLLRKLRTIYDITAVRLVIFQPYAGGADEWDTTPEALELFGKFAQKAALKAIDAFERGKKGLKPADFRPGNDACQWCRFSEKCNAKRKVASDTADKFNVLKIQESCTVTESSEMTLDQLKAEWDKLPLMRQHIADIEKAMYAALMRGEEVEGLKLVEGRPGNRNWSDTDRVEAFAKEHAIEDLLHKSVLLSPTEAEKVMDGAGWELLAGLVTRKPGQPSIATADDKRPAWTSVSDDDLSN